MAESEDKKPVVLVVDDNPVNLDIILESLENHGYEVLVAKDGESAIEQAKYAQPDIVVLDIMMPDIDGFEVCRRLKENDTTKEIPVIFITALSDIESRSKGFEVGAVDYITKPIQYKEVLTRIDTQLRLRQLQKKIDHLEKTNQDSQNRFETLAETVNAGVFIHQDGEFQYVNQTTEKITGYSRDELYQLKFWELIHPELREEVKQRGLARQQGEDVISHYEMKIITKDNQVRWLDFNGDQIKYQGRIAALGTLYDITEQKEALRRSEEQFETIANSAPVPVVITRVTDGVILFANDEFESIWGYKSQDLIGKKAPDFYENPEDRNRMLIEFKKQGYLHDYEMKIKDTSGKPIWASVSLRALTYRDESALMGMFYDISQRKEVEEALRKDAEKLETAVAERTAELEQKVKVIQDQQEAMLELSTPVVQIWHGVLISPLIGAIDSRRAAQIMHNILEAINQNRARQVIIDITGVPFVDTEVANHIIKTIQAAKLVGANCILVGISSEIAQTLVHIGIDLTKLTTFATLEDGLLEAFTRVKYEVVKK